MPTLYPPTPREIDDALAVVHSPALVHDQPALRATAWETLMRERGRRVNLTRLSALQDSARAIHLRKVINAACRDMTAERRTRPAFHDDIHPDFGGAA